MPGFGGPPDFGEIVSAVLQFTVFTGVLLIGLWLIIRYLRHKPFFSRFALILIPIVCFLVALIDVSMGSTSGLFSIFWPITVAIYASVLGLIVSIAGFVVK